MAMKLKGDKPADVQMWHIEYLIVHLNIINLWRETE